MSQPASTYSGDNFRDFYESVGILYPEEDLVYRSLRGILRRRFVLSFLSRFQGRLLDLGCNRGAYLSHYRNGPAVGVDIAFSVLKIARTRDGGPFFLQCDVRNLGFHSGSFDSILCSEVLEHVSQPERVFEEAARVLKPGGCFLLTTPNYRGEKPTWISIDEMRAYGVTGVIKDRYFHTAFRPDELRTMANRYGFEVLESGTFEKEVKYSTRIPVALFHILNAMNRITLRSQRIDRLNKRLLDSGSLWVFRLSAALGLNRWLTGLVKEGVRSYIFLRKPSAAFGHGRPGNSVLTDGQRGGS